MKRTKTLPNQIGLAGWLLGHIRGLRTERQLVTKQMHLLETLPLGGKRQLMLVSCAGESFLVGGGLESIETIVRVQAESHPDLPAKRLDRTCL
jgi:flagellar biogenesis protein FliO